MMGAPRVQRPWTTEDLRDAVISLRAGTVMPRDIPKVFNGVSRQTAQELVARLPADVEDSDERMSLTRAANEVSGYVSRQRQYTDWELRAAIVASFAGSMKRPAIRNMYGVPPGVVKDYLLKLGVYGNKKREPLPSVDAFTKEVNALEITKVGRSDVALIACCCVLSCAGG